ncbi:hypothetical protein [Egicoccus sp. AB-alg2]|uniref:hypothetical protein n=1 Tax=Egicoccus sp. AB-alg2 TaxID=3242693 RepID=UPI00359F0615
MHAPASRRVSAPAPLVLGLLLAVLVLTRVTALGRSLWWDEAFTASRYVAGGPATFLDPEAYVANNHVLFSAVTWATTRVTGTSEPMLRLWAVVPALVAVGLLLGLLWRRLGPWTAVVVAALVTASPLHLTLSTEARGYGLVLLASTTMLVIGVARDRAPRWRDDLLLSLSGVVAMLTFPPTVALYLAHAGTSLVRRPVDRLRLVVLTALAGGVTLAVYAPLLSVMLGRADRVGSRFADPVRWWSPVVDPLRLTATPALETAIGLRGVAVVVTVAVGVAGLAALLIGVDRGLGWHLLAALGGSVALLGLVGFHLADRYVGFLLPHAVTAVGVGVVAVVGGLRARPGHWPGWLAGGLAVLLVTAALPGLWRATTVPVQAFADAVHHLDREAPGIDVVTDRLHPGWRWYLADRDVEVIRQQERLDARLCEKSAPVAFLPDPDMGPLTVPTCVDDGARRAFEHLRPPGHLEVWVLTDATAP